MPSYLRPPRGVPPVGDAAVEALLAGHQLPADAPAELRPLAEAIAALGVAPAAHELAGEPAARAAYRGEFGRAARPARAYRRRNRVLGAVLSAKLAAAAAVAVGALTSAAYADVLPAPVQSLAHRTFGAPAPHPMTPRGQRGTQPRPAPTTPGADGLCQAWAEADGQGRREAVALRSLAAAAGGAAHVRAYCAAAADPRRSSTGQRAGHPAGQPSASSSSAAAVHATRQPGRHPVHRGHPSHPAHPGRPGTKPASHP